MRVRFFIFGISVSLVASGAIMQACGGDTSNTPAPSTDAGQEAAKEAAPADTGADVAVDSATCDTSADFTQKIPDASIADGQSSTGICVGCAKAHCKKDIDDCNALCECQGLMDKALTCYAKNSANPIACVGPFISASKETQAIGSSLIQCLQASCDTECPAPQTDGGPTDGGDGG